MVEFVKFLCRIFFGLFYRVQLSGMENVPLKGPVLLCSNHLSQLDMFFIGYRLKRVVRYMAKEELFRNPILGFILKRLCAFPVKRGKADVGSVRKALSLIEEGHVVGIFPEATRTRGKKSSEIRIKPGAAMLALNTGVDIVPVAIEGNFKLFSKVRVVYGKPFKLDVQPGEKADSDKLGELSKYIMDRIHLLLEVG